MLLIVGLLVAAIAATASPSYAGEWTDPDNFDTPDAFTNWHFGHTGDGTGGFSNLGSLSAPRNAFLFMPDAGFSSVGKTVHFQPVSTGSATRCRFVIQIDAQQNARTINVEAINPSTFKYVAVKTIQVNPNDGYVPQGIFWDITAGTPATVLIRISLIGNSDGSDAFARVDNLVASCSTTA